MLLDFNTISKVEDVKTKIIDMQKEWGGDIRIKAFNFSKQIEFEKRKSNVKDDSDLILIMLEMSIVDENDEPIFNKDNIEVLKKKNSQALFKIFKECLQINALDESGIEDKAKNY